MEYQTDTGPHDTLVCIWFICIFLIKGINASSGVNDKIGCVCYYQDSSKNINSKFNLSLAVL